MGTCTCIACVDIHNFQILIELINNALIPCQGLTNSLPIAPARDNLKLSWVQRECLEIFLPTNCTNFRASECKTVLVRAMPSAAENLEERQYVTGHVNKELIALVQIRATDPVAIPVAHCLRVNPCNSWAIIFRGISVAPAKDNFKLSQVVPVVVI